MIKRTFLSVYFTRCLRAEHLECFLIARSKHFIMSSIELLRRGERVPSLCRISASTALRSTINAQVFLFSWKTLWIYKENSFEWMTICGDIVEISECFYFISSSGVAVVSWKYLTVLMTFSYIFIWFVCGKEKNYV